MSTPTTALKQDPTTERSRYADVYARRSGQWKVIASHVVAVYD